MTGDDIVNQAFVDMGVIQPGESVASVYLTDGEVRLNELLSSLSTEQLMAYQQIMQTFPLTAGVSAYTLGSGGTFATTGGLRAQRVTSWRATSSDMVRGGPALGMDAFGAAAMAAQRQVDEQNVHAVIASITAAADSILALYQPPLLSSLSTAFTGIISAIPLQTTAPVPAVVGTDTSYPLINVRMWPPPSNAPGSLELAYFTPLSQISNFAAALALPEGWYDMLHFNLAVRMYQTYRRTEGIPPELAANAQNSKASLVAQNTPAGQGGAQQ